MCNESYVLTKNPDDGICNICLNQFDQLSEDHIPPESTGNHGPGIYRNYFNLNNGPHFREYTNGIRYKTICRDCNSNISPLDRSIATFYKQTEQLYIVNSNEHSLNIKPNGIIRGILAHFLAAKSTHNRSVFDDVCDNAFQNLSEPIPSNYNFYIKYYPWNDIRIIRDLILIGASPALTNIIKIKPWAFIISDTDIFDNNVMNWKEYFDFPWHQKRLVVIKTDIVCGLADPEEVTELPKMLGQLAAESIIGQQN